MRSPKDTQIDMRDIYGNRIISYHGYFLKEITKTHLGKRAAIDFLDENRKDYISYQIKCMWKLKIL